MSTPQFTPAWTPGPWHVGAQNDLLYVTSGRTPSLNNDHPNHEADRQVLARVIDRLSHVETEANATLITAAPALYEALQQALNRMVACMSAKDNGMAIPSADAAITLAKAAISRARGELA